MIKLHLQTRQKMFQRDGPEICPSSPFNERHLNFRFTTFSDSAVISAEVSSAGIVNLINCCQAIYSQLYLRRGLMCRGYIKRGLIYHTEDYCVGSGLNDVVEKEKKVSIFRTENGERGTPFVEVDRNITQFVDSQISDSCVQQVFSDYVRREGDVAAIFPFKRLDPGIFLTANADLDNIRKNTRDLRNWINKAKDMIYQHVDPTSSSARQKGRRLTGMLDAQLEVCDRFEEKIDEMMETFPAHSFDPKYFPRLGYDGKRPGKGKQSR